MKNKCYYVVYLIRRKFKENSKNAVYNYNLLRNSLENANNTALAVLMPNRLVLFISICTVCGDLGEQNFCLNDGRCLLL